MRAAPGAVGLAALLLLATASFAPALSADSRCAGPEAITRFKFNLPNTARAVRSGGPLVIVAIGSSSTEGVGASDPAHAYPAALGGELRRHWPRAHVEVINKGVGGEIAAQMLARFARDVLAYRPEL